jgi:hypothetical protein
MSCKMQMIQGSPRTLDRLPGLSGSHVQQLEVFRTMTGACGPFNFGGSARNIYFYDKQLSSLKELN